MVFNLQDMIVASDESGDGGFRLGIRGFRAISLRRNWWDLAGEPFLVFFNGHDGNRELHLGESGDVYCRVRRVRLVKLEIFLFYFAI